MTSTDITPALLSACATSPRARSSGGKPSRGTPLLEKGGSPLVGAPWRGRNKKHSPRLEEETAGAGAEKQLEELEPGTIMSGADELLPEPKNIPLEPELPEELLEPPELTELQLDEIEPEYRGRRGHRS